MQRGKERMSVRILLHVLHFSTETISTHIINHHMYTHTKSTLIKTSNLAEMNVGTLSFIVDFNSTTI